MVTSSILEMSLTNILTRTTAGPSEHIITDPMINTFIHLELLEN